MRSRIATAFGLVACAFSLAGPASAGTAYLENFDTGTALSSDSLVNYAGIDPFWTANQNGNVVQSTNSVGSFGNAIAADASGSGYFLFEGTSADPSGGQTFFASSTFAVDQNTDYTISFDLVNATTCNQAYYGFAHCSAIVQTTIDGNSSGVAAIGSPVSANDPTVDNYPQPWQEFTFSWNSGSNTSATLSFQDSYPSGTGNDFGIDNIAVTSGTPEPSTWLLGITGLAGFAIRRRVRA